MRGANARGGCGGGGCGCAGGVGGCADGGWTSCAEAFPQSATRSSSETPEDAAQRQSARNRDAGPPAADPFRGRRRT